METLDSAYQPLGCVRGVEGWRRGVKAEEGVRQRALGPVRASMGLSLAGIGVRRRDVSPEAPGLTRDWGLNAGW